MASIKIVQDGATVKVVKVRTIAAINDQGLYQIYSGHVFADTTERDTYFTANPGQLTTNLLISVGAGYQAWSGSAWVTKTAIIKGDTGDTGATGDTGPQGEQGTPGAILDWTSDQGDVNMHAGNLPDVLEPEDMVDATLLLTSAYHGFRPIDCNRGSTQTITIDTLTAAMNGAIMGPITKLGVGNVTIVLPGGVTWADGTSTSITLTSTGEPFSMRYNHSLLAIIFQYTGAYTQA